MNEPNPPPPGGGEPPVPPPLNPPPALSSNSGSYGPPEPPPPQPRPPFPQRYVPPPPPPRGSGLKFEAMQGARDFASVLQALLKHPGSVHFELNAGTRGIRTKLAIILLVCTAVYGLVMGSLTGGQQLWLASAKLTGGTMAALLICMPSLYIFLCLSGVDVRLGQVAGAALGMAATVSLLLIGFAPVAWLFSQGTDSIPLMGGLHLFFWIIGLWFGVRMVFGVLEYPKRSEGSHVKIWVLIFVLVSLQMSTVLRPLIGRSDTLLPTEKKFFLTHWFDSINSGDKDQVERGGAGARGRDDDPRRQPDRDF